MSLYRESYPGFAKVAHWTILILCILQVPTARAIQRTHMGHPFGLMPSETDLVLHQVHLYAGWAIGGLSLIMFVARVRGVHPRLPASMLGWQRFAANISHLALYFALAAMVATGAAASYLWAGFAAPHRVFMQLGVALVAIHVAAALWHHFSRRDGVLRSIWPGPFSGRQQDS